MGVQAHIDIVGDMGSIILAGLHCHTDKMLYRLMGTPLKSGDACYIGWTSLADIPAGITYVDSGPT